MNKLLPLLLSASLIAGCNLTPIKQTGDVLTTAVDIKYEVERTGIIDNVTAVPLSDEDAEVIYISLDRINTLRYEFEYYQKNPHMVIADIDEISIKYHEVANEYLKIKAVVSKNFTLYSPTDQARLVRLDTNVQKLDSQFNQLVESVQIASATNTAIQVANTIVKLAAVL